MSRSHHKPWIQLDTSVCKRCHILQQQNFQKAHLSSNPITTSWIIDVVMLFLPKVFPNYSSGIFYTFAGWMTSITFFRFRLVKEFPKIDNLSWETKGTRSKPLWSIQKLMEPEEALIFGWVVQAHHTNYWKSWVVKRKSNKRFENLNQPSFVTIGCATEFGPLEGHLRQMSGNSWKVLNKSDLFVPLYFWRSVCRDTVNRQGLSRHLISSSTT